MIYKEKIFEYFNGVFDVGFVSIILEKKVLGLMCLLGFFCLVKWCVCVFEFLIYIMFCLMCYLSFLVFKYRLMILCCLFCFFVESLCVYLLLFFWFLWDGVMWDISFLFVGCGGYLCCFCLLWFFDFYLFCVLLFSSYICRIDWKVMGGLLYVWR